MPDPGPLAQHAAYVIDEVTRDYGPEVELVDAVIVVELTSGAGDDAESTIGVYAMGHRHTAALGILMRGLHAAMAPDDDDE